MALAIIVPQKDTTYAIMHASPMPILSFEIQIAIGNGRQAVLKTDLFIKTSVDNPAATYADTLTSAREIKARGAKIIGVSDIESDVYDYWIQIPKISEILYPISEIIPIQLLAYYSALEKDTDPDYPRNLAKSVTVK